MSTLNLNYFIDGYYPYEYLEKFHVKILKVFHGLAVKLHGLLEKFNAKTLKEALQRESFSDVLTMMSLFFMVLYIIKTGLLFSLNLPSLQLYLTTTQNLTMFPY